MKASGSLVASMVAASTVALTSSSSSVRCGDANQGKNGRVASSEKEKFRPKFDGLRFIETLVTAHR